MFASTYGNYIDEPIYAQADLNDDGDFLDTGEKFYYVTNTQYSVAAILGTSGNILERYEYTPYGSVTIYTGDGGDGDWWDGDEATGSLTGNYILFTGQRYRNLAMRKTTFALLILFALPSCVTWRTGEISLLGPEAQRVRAALQEVLIGEAKTNGMTMDLFVTLIRSSIEEALPGYDIQISERAKLARVSYYRKSISLFDHLNETCAQAGLKWRIEPNRIFIFGKYQRMRDDEKTQANALPAPEQILSKKLFSDCDAGWFKPHYLEYL